MRAKANVHSGNDKGHQQNHGGCHDEAEDKMELFLGMHGTAFGVVIGFAGMSQVGIISLIRTCLNDTLVACSHDILAHGDTVLSPSFTPATS